ncbi:MAG: deoxyribodipyrimidine photo-lyase [Roseivirga sp.]|jgi:deoxyribodipyrimidine photo-lyase|uniref:cryptochrome/photolyase family protein n=1 Tax=Roseivirga sp. TaxID=1964215 RepID=UPI001B28822C|nr:deoxyribodipyrimidine photo-lyase [Roseivirga sp.]MBO6659222.1 deoxyribodipyrimidine photo-lyase [Roseivirga sp.]MBO6908041.1 deoxyribodipyrimidine photo-lyase [Roseivirga sp.]
MSKISFFWFRRDLRFIDNTGLYYALKETKDVLPVFIFDKNILDKLEDKADARVEFIQSTLEAMNNDLASKGSGIKTFYSTPLEAYKQLIDEYEIEAVYTNRDYEPYAKDRDKQVESLLKENNIDFFTFKDQVIYEYEEIVSGSGSFYKVFTPYSKSWKEKYKANRPEIKSSALRFENWAKLKNNKVHSLEDMGFEPTEVKIPSSNVEEEVLKHYDKKRDYPAQDATSRLGIHLRFGTISIRQLAEKAISLNETFLNELIWRDFYAMILANNPKVVDNAFKKEYDQIPWRQDEEGFEKWCKGKTGYPIVDAGMRQLNKTGYMHNRVRMVVASFLTKHLLIDWRWGEAYFAKKLLDFDLASNNGGWQWAAGTGTDAQPYFRVFNPQSQTEKFDPDLKYIKKWVPEYGTDKYPDPIVEHKSARQRAIDTYKKALDK